MYLAPVALLSYVAGKSSLCLLSSRLFSLCRRLPVKKVKGILQITMLRVLVCEHEAPNFLLGNLP